MPFLMALAQYHESLPASRQDRKELCESVAFRFFMQVEKRFSASNRQYFIKSLKLVRTQSWDSRWLIHTTRTSHVSLRWVVKYLSKNFSHFTWHGWTSWGLREAVAVTSWSSFRVHDLIWSIHYFAPWAETGTLVWWNGEISIITSNWSM